VTNIAKKPESLASGDLTVDVKLLSGADMMGESLKKTVDSLNSMFSEINSSTALRPRAPRRRKKPAH
jgi:hypothetical protein